LQKNNKKMKNKYTLEYIKENDLILFDCIGGSHAYGTNIETSDVDTRGVYIAELNDVLSNNYPDQINDATNDIVYYELGRFLSLVSSNNPNILEFLNSPEDCIKFCHPLFKSLITYKNDFITKACSNSFGGYARQQIKKAKGLNKKQNWEKDKVVRKDLLDFCYVLNGEKSIPWRTWNAGKYDEKFVGVVNIPNARDTYALFYDKTAYMLHSTDIHEDTRETYKKVLKEAGKPMGMGYKGLINTGHEDEDGKINYGISNQLRLSSVPKGEKVIATIVYNKDGYSEHCKDYKEYQEWLENRNEARYVETQEHGQRIDGKNMMHCMRLIQMSKEIGRGEGIQVRRSDREYLLSIRRGEIDLETLIELADKEIAEMDEIFDNCNLPNKVDKDLVNELLVSIRTEFYGLNQPKERKRK
jgi:predicted nucleotidyltransferase